MTNFFNIKPRLCEISNHLQDRNKLKFFQAPFFQNQQVAPQEFVDDKINEHIFPVPGKKINGKCSQQVSDKLVIKQLKK